MKKLIRAIIILLSILIATLLYLHFYSIEDKETSIEEAISERVGKACQINGTKRIDGMIFVYFTYEKSSIEYHGYLSLLKGFNRKYRLGTGYFEPYNDQLIFHDVKIDKKKYLVVLGPHINTKSILIDGTYKDLTLLHSGSNPIFDVFKSDIADVTINNYTYVENGVRYNIKRDTRIIPVIDYSGDLNSGPDNIVVISCFLVLLIGFVFSLLFTPEINRLEKLYYKFIKEIPSVEESDGNDYNMLN